MSAWSRKELKKDARAALFAHGWWRAFFAQFVSYYISYGAHNVSVIPVIFFLLPFVEGTGSGIYERSFFDMPIPSYVFMYLFVMLFFLVSVFLVQCPLSVGVARFFLVNLKKKPKVDVVLAAFSDGYLNVVKTYFQMELRVFLWSLLFIVPGIIKAYQYILVRYIIAENPHLHWKRALQLSKAMTKGNKWRIFAIMLSFLGWSILCAFSLGIGYIFLYSYIEQTYAALFATLREGALTDGYATIEELPNDVDDPDYAQAN